MAKLKKGRQIETNFTKTNGEKVLKEPSVVDMKTLTKSLESISSNDSIPLSGIYYDLDAVDSSFQSVISAFEAAEFNSISDNFVHCFAVKSCPLPDISFPTRSLPSNGR